jgi:hypothetical protein
MPGWLQVISKVNPHSYEVSALRWLLIGVPTNLALDTGVLVGAPWPALPSPPCSCPAWRAEPAAS